MRGHGERVAVRGEFTAHQSMVLTQWRSGPFFTCRDQPDANASRVILSVRS
jgi:hypothetical protein